MILLINDDLIWGTKIAGIVRQAGLEFVNAKTEGEVMERVKQHPPLLLIDLGAKSLDSLSLIRRLKQDAEFKAIPIIGYTFHTDQETWQKGVAAGCDQVVARSALQQTVVRELDRIKNAGRT